MKSAVKLFESPDRHSIQRLVHSYADVLVLQSKTGLRKKFLHQDGYVLTERRNYAR